MRLLIITQKVDTDDPILGFFHNWILALAQKFEKISVICLEKGSCNLPKNVQVYSLGKESGRSKIKYIKNFFNFILGLHRDYEAVFVHMNQEYILLGGFIWKILKKKIYFWRNHKYGNFFTHITIWLCNKVFCTSKFAFVAGHKKTIIMPVGIDTNKFSISNFQSSNKKNKILFLGRMSLVKKPDLLIEALNILNKKNIDFVCDFYGDPLSRDIDYYNSLKERVTQLRLDEKVNFYKGIPNYDTPKIYNEHEIFVNLTASGSFDKTILEAAACGCLLVVVNKSLSGEIEEMMITNENPNDIAEKINFWLEISERDNENQSLKLRKYILQKHGLNVLIEKLCTIIKK